MAFESGVKNSEKNYSQCMTMAKLSLQIFFIVSYLTVTETFLFVLYCSVDLAWNSKVSLKVFVAQDVVSFLGWESKIKITR